ncbi:MAG: DUF2330 domain-containing protein [Myxococcales bacterium]|nr:DUF2330 domain-containing protein [Myxococcales bacterium]
MASLRTPSRRLLTRGRAPASLGLAAALALTTAAAPSVAEACGGLFCDGAMPVPVDQTGENILFVVDGAAGTVEAHIQIQYMGDPDKFAWVIPVQAIPTFTAGSELLFSNLLNGTAPTYTLQAVSDCQDDSGDGLGCAAGRLDNATFDGESAGATGQGTSAGDSDGGPTIVKREIVGAFEIVVLTGGNAQELFDWLNDNGYAQDDDAPPILAEYLSEGYFFAAAKLIHGAGVDELQPLAMTYEGDRPCVPLRLTRIAAAEDMPIRVFALARERAAPTVYKHVVLNQALLDWIQGANNYFDVVIQAIDEAGGQAFITEYAGTSNVVSQGGLYDTRWNASIFAGATPVTNGGYSVIDALTSQGLMECFDFGECTYNHPMLLPLLRNYLPTPPGVAENDFYECLSCFEELIDDVAWDGAKFAADLDARIIQPGKHAVDLLNTWPYVTRMLTIMSPHEMTADPEFVTNPDLPDVPNAHTATRNIPCEGSDKVVFDDERELLLEVDGSWTSFEAPFAERVEVIAPAGAPQVDVDNGEAIDDAIRASNKRFDYDNGTRANCSVRAFGRSLGGALSLGLVFAFAWRGRRRKRA